MWGSLPVPVKLLIFFHAYGIINIKYCTNAEVTSPASRIEVRLTTHNFLHIAKILVACQVFKSFDCFKSTLFNLHEHILGS